MSEPETDRLLGRTDEVARLVPLLTGERPVGVVGEAGIGKTTLVRAAALAAGRALREGGGFATLSWMPYLPLRRAVDGLGMGDPAEVAALVEERVGPDLLFVDDLQWADRDTRAVVELLGDRVGLVAAIRDGDPGTADAIALVTGIGGEIVRLGGLDGVAAAAVARRMRPSLNEREVRDVVERAGGNPLLIEELSLRGRGSTSLTRAIASQLEALDGEERELVELIALAGRPLPVAALTHGTERLVELGLTRISGDAVEIRHALIAEAVRGQLPDAERRPRLERLASIVDDPAERARLLLAAGRPGEAHRTAVEALAVATDPHARSGLLTIAAETAEGEDAGRLRVEAAQAVQGVGDPEGSVRLLESPIEGPPELQALRAAVLAYGQLRAGAFDAMWATLDDALPLRPDPSSDGAIELATTRAIALVNTRGQMEDGIALMEATAEHAAADVLGARFRGVLATFRIYAGRSGVVPELEAAWADSVASAEGVVAAAMATNLHYAILIERGAREALAFALEAASTLEGLGWTTRGHELRAEASQVSIFAGDLAGTVVLADDLLARPLGRRPLQRVLSMRGQALALLGRFEDAERTFDEAEPNAIPDFDGRGCVLWGRADQAYWSGVPERALAHVNEAVLLPALGESEYLLPVMTAAWANLDLGRPPSREPDSQTFRVMAGAAPEYHGIVALGERRDEDALASFDEAAALWAGYHRPREAICAWAAGEAARRAGEPSAVRRLEEAHRMAVEMGFEPLANRVRRSLRLAGQRVAAVPARRGGGLLTAREREVVALVGRGLTNNEISRRMGLGRPTVGRMLSNAMLKLGAASRTQAVALVAEGR